MNICLGIITVPFRLGFFLVCLGPCLFLGLYLCRMLLRPCCCLLLGLLRGLLGLGLVVQRVVRKRGLHDELPAKLTTMGDTLDRNLTLLQGHIHEAILVVITVHRRLPLGGDATAAAGGHPHGGVQEVVVQLVRVVVPHHFPVVAGLVHVLDVPVTSDDEIDLVFWSELFPVGRTPARGEVCHDDAPVGSRLWHHLVQPLLLFFPELAEPILALPNAARPDRGAGDGLLIVVRLGADVVRGRILGVQCVEDVGVQEVVVDSEVWVPHLGLIIHGWSHPTPC
mmetsp:Transcript_51692/g.137703  ORF Transcript_51692/g.137703 Transcript_51692/m.137703 type:complete len:281 (+) Transcript_51692:489-1331(+)